MKRSWTSVVLNGKLRAKTTIVGDPIEVSGREKNLDKWELLRIVMDRPDLSHCQGADFEHMTLSWSGSAWTLEFYADLPTKT